MEKEALERVSFALQKALTLGSFNLLESKQIESDLKVLINLIKSNDGAKEIVGDSV